jgi:hypothetical protein
MARATTISYTITDRACTINGVEVPADCVAPSALSSPDLLTPFGSIIHLPAPIAVGPAHVRMTGTVSVSITALDGRTLTEAEPRTLLDDTTNVQDGEPMFLSDGPPDPAMDAMKARVSITPDVDDPKSAHLDIAFSCPARTMFVGDAFIRSPSGTERKLGQAVIEFGNGSVSFTLPPPAVDPAFAIILRPTNELAGEQTWPMTTYQHEIVIATPEISIEQPAAK